MLYIQHGTIEPAFRLELHSLNIFFRWAEEVAGKSPVVGETVSVEDEELPNLRQGLLALAAQ